MFKSVEVVFPAYCCLTDISKNRFQKFFFVFEVHCSLHKKPTGGKIVLLDTFGNDKINFLKTHRKPQFRDCITSNTVALLEVLWQDIEATWPFNVLWILESSVSEYLNYKGDAWCQRQLKQMGSFGRKTSKLNFSEGLLGRVKFHFQEDSLKSFLLKNFLSRVPVPSPGWNLSKPLPHMRFLKIKLPMGRLTYGWISICNFL